MATKYEIKFIVEKDGSINEAKQEILDDMTKCGIKAFEVRPLKETRTERQNRALHLLFEQLARELNEHGITARQIFSQPVEHFWTPELVKEMWRKIQYAMFKKKSTTQLLKQEEIDRIYDTLSKVIAERTNGEVSMPEFPSLETFNPFNYE